MDKKILIIKINNQIFRKIRGKLMKPGEEFEIRCYEYLKRLYTTDTTSFHLEGGMNSTKSDIAVIKNGYIDFYIEVKDTLAQSGQFVLLPDEESRTFVFSPRNHSEPNEMTEIIIKYMNSDFDRFNNAGTAGESLNIDSTVFSNWIIQHYAEKNVKYVISYKNDYVILPIRKFAKYFTIFAKYRIKKSGSGEPAKKDISTVKAMIQSFYPMVSFSSQGKKLFANIDSKITQDRFIIGKYNYYFSKHDNNIYEIRRLSNTYNMNVIFSIQLKQSQDQSDLDEFKADLF